MVLSVSRDGPLARDEVYNDCLGIIMDTYDR